MVASATARQALLIVNLRASTRREDVLESIGMRVAPPVRSVSCVSQISLVLDRQLPSLITTLPPAVQVCDWLVTCIVSTAIHLYQ